MSETLSKLSDELSEVVAAAAPSVVRVEARRRLPASGIVWNADGIIVTAHHVVERDNNIIIGLPDGTTSSAELVGRDPTTDTAVLRIRDRDLSPAARAAPEEAPKETKVGHLVLAVGRPGPSVLATLGIVSALGGTWRTPAGGRLDRYLQTDVAMYPGFSGGPLVDASGRVLGVNTSALVRGTALVVPVTSLAKVVDALLSHGKIRRGFLGVGAQPVRLPSGLAEQVGQETGLMLVSVEEDGPAEKGGLLLGDTLVAVDGQPTRHVDDLLALLSADQIGSALPVRFIRGGSPEETKVVVGDRG